MKQTMLDMMQQMGPYMGPVFWTGAILTGLGFLFILANFILNIKTGKAISWLVHIVVAVTVFFVAAHFVGAYLGLGIGFLFIWVHAIDNLKVGQAVGWVIHTVFATTVFIVVWYFEGVYFGVGAGFLTMLARVGLNLKTGKAASWSTHVVIAVGVFFVVAHFMGTYLGMDTPYIAFGDVSTFDIIKGHFWVLGTGLLVAAVVLKLLLRLKKNTEV